MGVIYTAILQKRGNFGRPLHIWKSPPLPREQKEGEEISDDYKA